MSRFHEPVLLFQVVDMALALEAVSLLEKTAVTKEALEVGNLTLAYSHMCM